MSNAILCTWTLLGVMVLHHNIFQIRKHDKNKLYRKPQHFMVQKKLPLNFPYRSNPSGKYHPNFGTPSSPHHPGRMLASSLAAGAAASATACSMKLSPATGRWPNCYRDKTYLLDLAGSLKLHTKKNYYSHVIDTDCVDQLMSTPAVHTKD